MFVCKTSSCCTLVKCQRPLPSVPPTGSFKEVSPCPPRWHLQPLSFHPFVPHSGSKSCHLSPTKIIQVQQLHLCYRVHSTPDKKESPYPISALVWWKDQLCRIKSIPGITRLPPYGFKSLRGCPWLLFHPPATANFQNYTQTMSCVMYKHKKSPKLCRETGSYKHSAISI